MSSVSRMTCGNCKKGIKFPTEKAGMVAKCPSCKTPQKLVAEAVKAEIVAQPKPKAKPPAAPSSPAMTAPVIKERSAVSDIPAQPAVDSKIARFVSDGQPVKTVGKLLARVDKLCTASETPEYIAVQHLPSIASPDAIVLTDRRVIIFRGKALGRMNLVDVQWMDVGNIHISEGVVGASIHVTGSNGHTEKIDHLPKEQARSVYRVGQLREEAMREFRRDRKMEEDRNAAGGVVVNTAVSPIATPSPAPTAEGGGDLTSRLAQLKSMLENDLISQDEFDAKKAEILASL